MRRCSGDRVAPLTVWRPGRCFPFEGLRVLARLRRAGEADAPGMAGSAREGQSLGGSARLGVFLEDELFEGVPLSQILVERGLEPLCAPDARSLGAWIDALPSVPGILILPFGGICCGSKRWRSPWLQGRPLRARGARRRRAFPAWIWISPGSRPAASAAQWSPTARSCWWRSDSSRSRDRIARAARTSGSRAFFPIQIEEGGNARTEYALSLFSGAADHQRRGAAARDGPRGPLRPSDGSSQELDLCLRVVEPRPRVRHSEGLAEVVFFLGVPAEAAAILEAEVVRLRDR